MISRDNEFAEKYKKLVESRERYTSIKSNLDTHLSNVSQQAQETAASLKDIQIELESYNEEKRNRKDTWEAKRTAYLEEVQSKQKSFDLGHRRELDKLEEKYAKLTRESTYANLVGTNTWNYK
ncbi:hypothetical protein K450DRAFT_219894 [Umbelopsis ramanniana AG]|uniref:Uncharacterized protein n=1 Tax=Umbelopsis ramanniana AG TaxID=1314678 RepID=A0AAD5EJZ3_UMBRA|nr:uncharacterized protein K450DRAFT_219894 [Umbelopsis ramanniana AG]KAI8583765.1 hypothetical protein K450DRAFT_219894 [Umbelopsis ramanniana AG]